MSIASAVLVGLARALPMAWLAPPLGGPARAARLVVAALLVAVSWPVLIAAPMPGGAGLVRELLVGATLGLVASVPLRAAQAAGLLLDGALWRRGRPLGDAYLLLALALFASLGGPRVMMVAWGQSYAAVPIGVIDAAGGLRVAVDAGARLVATACALVAPALAALLLAELVCALLARAQPRLAATVEARPLHIVAALVAAGGALASVGGGLGALGGLRGVVSDAARALGGGP